MMKNNIKAKIADVELMDERIKALKAENKALKVKQQWIRVENELPEYDLNVLVVGWHKFFQEKRIGLACRLDFGGWSGYYTGNITHWMPLPNVPEEEE